MRVKCIRAFASVEADGKTYAFSEGDTFDLPAGADWLKAGFVQEVQAPPLPKTPTKPSVHLTQRKGK